jgi:hypothetical protein
LMTPWYSTMSLGSLLVSPTPLSNSRKPIQIPS